MVLLLFDFPPLLVMVGTLCGLAFPLPHPLRWPSPIRTHGFFLYCLPRPTIPLAYGDSPPFVVAVHHYGWLYSGLQWSPTRSCNPSLWMVVFGTPMVPYIWLRPLNTLGRMFVSHWKIFASLPCWFWGFLMSLAAMVITGHYSR